MITSGIVVAMAKRKQTWQKQSCQFCYEEGPNARSPFVVKSTLELKQVPIKNPCQFQKCSEILRWPMISNTLGYWAETWINGKIKN